MSHADAIGQPGTSPAGNSQGESWGEWFDRHSRTFFIAPAVVLILIFAIFPTFYSIVFALSRVRFTGDGLQFRFVWFQNFAKQFFGNEQVHFLGKIGTMSVFGTVVPCCRDRRRSVVALPIFREDHKLGRHAGPPHFGRHGHLHRLGHRRHAAFRQLHRHAAHDAVLCVRRLRPAVRDRNRPGLPVLAADLGKELLPRDLLHSADDHAAWAWATP